MASLEVGGKLIVAWTGDTGMTPNTEFPDANLHDETTRGHVSTFTVGSDFKFRLESDVVLDYCVQMGGITASQDGKSIGILCHSELAPGDLPAKPGTTVVDVVATNPTGFGWTNTEKGRTDKMYLLEWTAGMVTDTPQAAVCLNKAIGGWYIGHYEATLSNDATQYWIDLKATAGGHEGETRWLLQRAGHKYDAAFAGGAGWGCGHGHVMANRVTHNTDLDSWARYCVLDARVWAKDNPGGDPCDSITWGGRSRPSGPAPATPTRWS